MYDELVKRLRDFAVELRKAEDALLVRDAADAIEELQAAEKKYLANIGALETENQHLKREREWIPVTERLPEENGNYLVAVKCPRGKWVEICACDGRDWVSVDEYAEYATKWVTHWMPLPTPPTAEEGKT